MNKILAAMITTAFAATGAFAADAKPAVAAASAASAAKADAKKVEKKVEKKEEAKK